MLTERASANAILSLLPEQQRQRICDASEVQELPKGLVLYEAETRLDYVYFIEHGVTSLAVPLKEGKAIESSSVGREGMVGLPLFLQSATSPFRAMQDISGRARRIPRDVFLDELERGPHLRAMLSRYTLATLMAASQRVACNVRHTLEQRLITWLLITDEQVEGESFRATHEGIAEILGVRRASVTVAAGALHDAGYITYSRGRIAIINRIGLEALACECYAKISRANNYM